jgi:glycosyltransferase involved in cell wall biosynthesis
MTAPAPGGAPAVSVILPTYNRAATLRRAVHSVLHQSFGDLELIVVDDGSDDGTSELLSRFADPRLRVLRREVPGGPAQARNAGLRAARGALLAFQDSDDEWLLDKLERQVALMRASAAEVGLVTGGYLLGGAAYAGTQYASAALDRGQGYEADLIDGRAFITPLWLLRRSALDAAGLFDESLHCLEDWELLFRLHRVCRFIAVPGAVLVKNGGADSVYGRLPLRFAALERILETHAEVFGRHRRQFAAYREELGRWFARTGQRGQALRQFSGALRLAPQRPRLYAEWLIAALGLRGAAAGAGGESRPAAVASSAGEAAPLVSVVLPTHNRAALLGRAMRSVLAQTHAALELIVVDDGSTDATPQLLAACADPRLRVVHLPGNSGPAAARNAGIRAARGEFIAFQDDDDYWLVDKLEAQLAGLQSAVPLAGWCLGGFIQVEPKGVRYVGGLRYFRQLDHRLGLGEAGPDRSLIATPNWLVRRDALQRAGLFDERMRSWEDVELGLRLEDACRVVFVDEPLYVQDHLQGSGVSKAEPRLAMAMQVIMERHAHRWSASRRILARHYYMIGRIESLYQPPPAGRGWLWKSLRLNPLQWHAWAALGVSALGPQATTWLTRQVRRVRLALAGRGGLPQ